jgi:hypothetical protein
MYVTDENTLLTAAGLAAVLAALRYDAETLYYAASGMLRSVRTTHFHWRRDCFT